MRLLGIALLLAAQVSLPAQDKSRETAIVQWRDHRVGLFVHWGVATGRALPQSHSHARRSELNPSGSVPAGVYDQYYKEFNPAQYDPDAWLKLAHEAGMRYAVFVAKHHDGFSMYRSAVNPYNIMATPYGKDVAAMFAEACKRQGLALGWQISPKDWRNPDFNTHRHDRYNAFYEKVIEELATQYGPLTAMWFDGIEPVGPEKWKGTPERVAAFLHRTQPGIMLSNHGGAPEDFVSFEAMVGPFDRKQPWEMTEQINPSGWVFNKPMPTRPFRELLRNLVYTISRDGNYLLDIGPMQDGRLYPPDAERLQEFAAWMKINAEGVHGTRGGPFRDGDWGGATCKGPSVYLFLSDRVGTELALPAIAAKVRAARRLDGGPLQFKADRGGLHLTMPDRKGSRPVFLGVKLELDRAAFDLPVVDVQTNLAAQARIVPSSVRSGWGVEGLFDNLGDTAWDPDGDDLASSLDFDLGKAQPVGGMSFSQRTQRLGWHQYYRFELKVRNSENEPWQNVYQGRSCLGGIPVLELKPVRARYLRLEIVKPRNTVPVQLAELRIFAPLLGAAASSSDER
jgi:alpha-L-fucosidase